MTIDEQKLELEKQKFKHEQNIEDVKLELERQKLLSESKFSNRHLGSIISFAAIIISISQIIVAQISKNKELEIQQIQKEKEINLNASQSDREWNLKATEFIATYQDLFFGSDTLKQSRIAKVMLVTFPPQITSSLFDKLATSADNQLGKNEWISASSIASKMLLLRLDGMYEHKGSNYTEYIRFFPNGEVMMATSTDDSKNVERWLKPGGTKWASEGKLEINKNVQNKGFVVEGSNIRFSVTGPTGVVDYTGYVIGDKLQLDFFSRINNNHGSEEYNFVLFGS